MTNIVGAGLFEYKDNFIKKERPAPTIDYNNI